MALAGAVVCASVPVTADRPGLSALVVAGLALAAMAAAASRSAPALRAVGLLVLVGAFTLLGAHAVTWLAWPLPILLALLVGAGCARAVPALRPAAPWLRFGTFSPAIGWLFVATLVASAAALAWWAWAVRPPAPPFVRAFVDRPLWTLVVAVCGFAVVNAFAEEVLYRGVVLTELAAVWAVGPALVVQAAAFGLAHLHGFPSGWSGMAMAAGWGLVLGVIRLRSDGIGLPYLAHVVADSTIGVAGVLLLR